MTDEPIRRAQGECRWDGVDVLDYKREGAALFKEVTRQLLFRTDDGLRVALLRGRRRRLQHTRAPHA